MTQLKFIETLKSEEMEVFSKKVANKEYDNIDWFNLEIEIEKICKKEKLNLEKYSTSIEKALEDRFKKVKKYVVKPIELNIVFEEILNELVDTLDGEVPVNDFYVKEYEIESTIKNQVTKSINYLSSYGVIKKSKRSGNGVHYKTQSEFWNKKAQYIISDSDTLKVLVPIILSYIKNGNIKTYNVQTLFQKFSTIIEYAIIPALGHNSIVDIEFEILDACSNEYDIKIEYEDKNITIKPKKIVIIGSEKYIRYIENNQTIDIKIEDIKLIDILDNGDSFTSNINISTLSVFNYDNLQSNSQNIKEIILECDTVIYEYFKMKPLKNLKVYATQEKLEEFHQTIEYKPKNNKFYIVATDTEEMILSTVLHCLPYAVIINNNDLNDKLIQKFKDYANKADIDICPQLDSFTPNNPSLDSNNETKNGNNNNEIKNSSNTKSNKVSKKDSQTMNDLSNPDNNII